MWILYAILASMIWGLDYALAGRIYQHRIAPVTLLAFQMLTGGSVFLLVSYFTTLGEDLAAIRTNSSTFWLTFSALFGFSIGNLFIALSVQAKNATLAGLIEISYPIFIAIFSLLLFKENHVTPSALFGGALIFTGVTIIYLFN